jgi:hypothetical protein
MPIVAEQLLSFGLRQGPRAKNQNPQLDSQFTKPGLSGQNPTDFRP